MQDIFYNSSDGKNIVHAVIWLPETQIKGVVQIIHGMEEYAARYAPFAGFLTKEGFMVCAEDHLGHGKTAKEGELGYFPENHGERYVLKDIYALTLKAKEMAPDAPYFVMGHSMGSFFCRAYLAEYGSGLSGAIIMGSGYKPQALMDTAIFVTEIIGTFKGWHSKSKLVNNLAFGSYNKKFNGNTGYEWLSRNGQNVQNYIKDPYCGFGFTLGGFLGLFRIIKRACAKKTLKAIPQNLPMLVVSGDKDPVGDYGDGVIKLGIKLRSTGHKDVLTKLYPDMRHEILNDDLKEEVQEDILNFLTDKIYGALIC